MFQTLILVTWLISRCIAPISAASLKSLSQPELKLKPIKQSKRRIVKKKPKPIPKIESAILVELPSYRSLVPARSTSEIQIIDHKALDLLFSAAVAKDPELAQAEKIINKNFLNRGKEQALELIENSKVNIEQEYRRWRSYYQERYQRDHKLTQLSAKAAQNLISMTDQTTLLELEKLMKANR